MSNNVKIDLRLFKTYAREGYTREEIATLMDIDVRKVDRLAKDFGVTVVRFVRIPAWKISTIYRLYDKGIPVVNIARRLEIDPKTVYKYLDRRSTRAIGRKFRPGDPRSEICQRINFCTHSRCHLHNRCPAYLNYLNKNKED